MPKRRTSDELYRASRTTRDIEAVASGHPSRVVRRVKNRLIGHLISRMLRGLWRL